jgi:hypothetical protein
MGGGSVGGGGGGGGGVGGPHPHPARVQLDSLLVLHVEQRMHTSYTQRTDGRTHMPQHAPAHIPVIRMHPTNHAKSISFSRTSSPNETLSHVLPVNGAFYCMEGIHRRGMMYSRARPLVVVTSNPSLAPAAAAAPLMTQIETAILLGPRALQTAAHPTRWMERMGSTSTSRWDQAKQRNNPSVSSDPAAVPQCYQPKAATAWWSVVRW